MRFVLYIDSMIKPNIETISKSSGVYRFLDANGEVLYVGKAKNLKNRIKQYFQKELKRGPGIEQMVQLASDIKWIETDSEIEAVLLEAEIINKLKPKYNVRQKDDKSFLVIKITRKNICHFDSTKSVEKSHEISRLPIRQAQGARDDKVIAEEFSCVELVRFKNIDLKDKSAEYFGPYPAGLLLKKSLRYLRKVFPYRDCSKTKFNTYKRQGRPCIYGDIRVCTAPCAGWVNTGRYSKNIMYLKKFLRGKKENITVELEKEMRNLSRLKKFEEAALVRNQIQALDHIRDVAVGLRDDVFSSGDILFRRIECFDISNIGEDHAVGSMVVFSDGRPETSEYRKFRVKDNPPCHLEPFDCAQGRRGVERSHEISPTSLKARGRNDNLRESDLSRLQQVLERRFKNNWPRPDLIVIDGGINQLNVAKTVLKEFGLNIPAISISKGAERKKNDFHFSDSNMVKYFSHNQELKNTAIAARDEAHRFAIEYYRKLHRKSLTS